MSTDTGTALIVVDLQHGTMANAHAYTDPGWLDNAVTLIAAFRERGLPVVIATVTGTPAGRTTYAAGGGREWPAAAAALVPEIVATGDDITVSRRALSVFAGTGLADRLAALDVSDAVIVGIAASFGVESTARHAYDLGYNVVVVSDAIADLQQATFDHALTSIFPVVGRVITTAEISPGPSA